ncbi:MAG TPA: hypothetical protein VNQ76_21865 [Planctomicrobium sp.]|nr:hypothetical protein [Planctomicrobium sp.]
MASSKPTALHLWFVFFVMSTLILALVCYLNMKELATAQAAAATANETSRREAGEKRVALDEIHLLKRKLGYADFETVGAENDTSPNTAVGKLNQDLALYGATQVQPSPANPNVAATLQSLRSALNAALAAVDERKAELVKVQQELAQEQQAHMSRLSEVTNSQKSSEQQLQELVAMRTELVAEKDREIGRRSEQLELERREKESLRDEIDALRKQKNVETGEYEGTITFLRGKLNKLEDLSFDKADGVIRRVDNTTRTVWINLGSQDGLKPQVSFSVYTKGHQGVGRGNADIKAKVEVTRIRGPHLSEAVILNEDLARPIQENDPIYSPIWSKGLKEHFSFVGLVDMTGDGKSDRDLLRAVLDTAGSGIELEVDDAGNRVPEEAQLTVKSKFLVVGELEDPTNFPGSNLQKQEEIRKTHQLHKELAAEALRKGIKVISFRDFLNYIGYENQQRLYNPESRTNTLQAGQEKTATESFDGDNRLQLPNKYFEDSAAKQR